MRIDVSRLGESYSVPAISEAAVRVRGRLFQMAQSKNFNGLKFAVIPGDAVSDVIVSNGLYEKEYLLPLSAIFASNSQHFGSSCALDVGANIGNHACFLSHHFSRVIAFEPGETAFRLLQANISLNNLKNVKAVQCGLGDANEVLTFRENREGNLGDSRVTSASSDDAINVEIFRGDDFLEKNPVTTPISFIKIDVQGFEQKVICGLAKTIETHHPVIQFENSFETNPSPMSLIEDFGFYDFYVYHEAQYAFKNKQIRRLARILTNRVNIIPYTGQTGYHDMLAIPR